MAPTPKRRTTLGSEQALDRYAADLAFETMTHAQWLDAANERYINVLNDQHFFPRTASFVDIKQAYKNGLMEQMGKEVEVPVVRRRLLMERDEQGFADRLIEADLRLSSESEYVEDDHKLQCLLLFRQYLRILRRFMTLSLFRDNKGEEVPKLNEEMNLEHKFFERDGMTQATEDRFKKGMNLAAIKN